MARPKQKTQSCTKSGAPQSQVINVSGASSPIYRLSNELIFSILDLLYLNDLVGFALSCRFVYSRAGPALDRHKALWRQYYTLANPHNKTENQVFPRALTEFIRHPEHARYVHHLYVRRVIPIPLTYHVPPGFPQPPRDDGEDKQYQEASLDLLEQAVHDLNISDQDWKQPGNVYRAISSRDWLKIMLEGLAEADEHVIEALLILLLPNLKALTLSVAMFRHPSIYMALNRALSPRLPVALPKLEMIELTGASFCRYSHVLAGLERLARLPSFKYIRCVGVRIYGNDESDWYLTPSEVFSGITNLEYYECYFVQGPMLQLLEAAKSLKHFVFTTFRTPGVRWMPDPYYILSCISESARQTLVSLNLSGFWFNEEGGPCRRTRSKGNLEILKSQGGCLRDFPSLKEITVDFGLLFAGSKFFLCTLGGEMPSAARTLELHFEEDNIISQDLAIKKIYHDLKDIKNGGFNSALDQVRMTNVTAVAMEQVFRHLNPKDLEDVGLSLCRVVHYSEDDTYW